MSLGVVTIHLVNHVQSFNSRLAYFVQNVMLIRCFNWDIMLFATGTSPSYTKMHFLLALICRLLTVYGVSQALSTATYGVVS